MENPSASPSWRRRRRRLRVAATYGLDDTTCAPCPAGGTTAQTGSAGPLLCIAGLGYQGPPGGPFTPCPIAFYAGAPSYPPPPPPYGAYGPTPYGASGPAPCPQHMRLAHMCGWVSAACRRDGGQVGAACAQPNVTSKWRGKGPTLTTSASSTYGTNGETRVKWGEMCRTNRGCVCGRRVRFIGNVPSTKSCRDLVVFPQMNETRSFR